MPYTGSTRRDTLFIFLRMRHRNTLICISHVGCEDEKKKCPNKNGNGHRNKEHAGLTSSHAHIILHKGLDHPIGEPARQSACETRP